VLLVNGEHDLPEFLELADQLAGALPDAERARIDEAGGFPLWEFPDRVNARVRRFLDRVG
jgi:pimeloyl-ACP methyl ester carboxylesterase